MRSQYTYYYKGTAVWVMTSDQLHISYGRLMTRLVLIPVHNWQTQQIDWHAHSKKMKETTPCDDLTLPVAKEFLSVVLPKLDHNITEATERNLFTRLEWLHEDIRLRLENCILLKEVKVLTMHAWTRSSRRQRTVFDEVQCNGRPSRTSPSPTASGWVNTGIFSCFEANCHWRIQTGACTCSPSVEWDYSVRKACAAHDNGVLSFVSSLDQHVNLV